MAYYLFLAPKTQYIADLLDEVLTTRVLVNIGVSAFSKFLYTTLAGVDFMVMVRACY